LCAKMLKSALFKAQRAPGSPGALCLLT
jgi:hypothetical protein